MGRTVIKGEDGFFRISGQPESVYYGDAHHAQTVAANLDAADDAAALRSDDFLEVAHADADDSDAG